MKFGLAETRVTIGLVQGLLLAGLLEATLHHIAPFNKPMVLALSWRLLNVVALFLLLDLQRVRLGALLGLLGMRVAVSCVVTTHAVHQGIGLPGRTLLGEDLFWLLIFIIQALGFATDKDGSGCRSPAPHSPVQSRSASSARASSMAPGGSCYRSFRRSCQCWHSWRRLSWSA